MGAVDAVTETDPRHGTVAGYTAHKRSKVPPCDDCRAANRRAVWNQRKGLARGDYNPCVDCGKPCTSIRRICRMCSALRIALDRDLKQPRREDALTDGRWVRDGLILRWEAA